MKALKIFGICISIAGFVVIVLLTLCWSNKSDIEKASTLSKVEIPENSLCLYSEHQNRIQEIGDEFVFKILPENREEFCRSLEKSKYEKLIDTIVLIRFCPLSHIDTIRNGYMKYEECLINYYYDSDKGLFYVRNIND